MNKVGVTLLVGKAIRGPLLMSIVDGHFPTGTHEIALGATTMRQVHARLGSIVRVTAPVLSGGTKTTPFRVVATATIPGNTGSGGLGTGAGMTLDGFLDASCPSGSSQAACKAETGQNLIYVLLATGVPGPQGQAAIAHYLKADASVAKVAVTPTSLVNFGEAVNFPLILGLILVVFGAATLVHLLVVSVARRRRETGLLKALGFVNAQNGVGGLLAGDDGRRRGDRRRHPAGHCGRPTGLATVRHQPRRRAGVDRAGLAHLGPGGGRAGGRQPHCRGAGGCHGTIAARRRAVANPVAPEATQPFRTSSAYVPLHRPQPRGSTAR